VDNEVWVDAAKHYLKVGDFTQLTIVSAQDFDLHAVPAN
jgi:ribosomal protein S12 methylthiotransferase